MMQWLRGKATPPVNQADVEEHLFAEKARIEARSRVRQFVFGSLDGLLVPLGVVSGVAGGTGNLHAVIVAGFAEAFAGALSMGAGEFLSGRAEAQVQRYEIQREKDEIEHVPDVERREIEALFRHEGISAEGARTVASIVTSNKESWLKTMVEKELGLSVDAPLNEWLDALYMGVSYLVASVVPILPYFFLPLKAAFITSLIATFAALVIIGVVKGRLAQLNLLRSAAEVALIGAISGLGGYVLGDVLPRLFGK
jgi:vacuolar iron transporter family protein